MLGRLFLAALCFIAHAPLISSSGLSLRSEFVISNIVSIYDLSVGHTFVRSQTTLSIKRKAFGSGFLIAIPSSKTDSNISSIDVILKPSFGASSGSPLKVTKGQFDPSNQLQYYSVPIDSEHSSLDIIVLYTNILQPYPAEIDQDQPQKLLLQIYSHYTTPYLVDTQKTTVKLSTRSTLLSFSENSSVKKTGNNVIFGPYENTVPGKNELVRVHFKDNTPLLSSKIHEITYTLTHWGASADVFETHDIVNTGAKLKNHFNRMNYMLSERQAPETNVLRNFVATIPQQSTSIYFKDAIGNVSSSSIVHSAGKTVLVLGPRFPLFGGWKYSFFFGYTTSLNTFTKQIAPGLFKASIPFFGGIKEIQIEKNILKVILPEGAKVRSVIPPFDVDKQYETVTFTYFDTLGRPTVIIEKANIIPEIDGPIEITYELTSDMLWLKPLTVSAALFLIFFLSIVYVRTDFSITKNEEKEKLLKLTYIQIEYKKLIHQFSQNINQINQAFEIYKQSRDSASFKVQTQQLESQIEGNLKLMASFDQTVATSDFINGSTQLRGLLTKILATQKEKHVEFNKLLAEGDAVNEQKKKSTLDRLVALEQTIAELRGKVHELVNK